MSANSSARSWRPLRHASKASAISPFSRQNSNGTSVVLKPLTRLFCQACCCADLISTTPSSGSAPGLRALLEDLAIEAQDRHLPVGQRDIGAVVSEPDD